MCFVIIIRTLLRRKALPAIRFEKPGGCRTRKLSCGPLSIERDAEAFFLAPNHRARIDLVLRVDDQRELVRNGGPRPDVESDPGWRQIAQYAGDSDIAKTDRTAL